MYCLRVKNEIVYELSGQPWYMDLLFNVDNHPLKFEHCKPNGTCVISRNHMAVHPINCTAVGWLIL
jgi:hypothetical protein